MPGPIFKGYPGVTIHAEEPQFDAETGALSIDVTYQGSRAAIFDVGADLRAQGISYQCSQDGPVHTLRARVPTVVNTDQPQDRYEITTEPQDKSIFEHPVIQRDALKYDSGISEGADTYQALAARAAAEHLGFSLAGGFDDPVPQNSRFDSVVRHLRAGVTGWQVDFIVLRRFRRAALEFARDAGKMNLDAGGYIYSTDQLNLPKTVYFNLPATPDDPSEDYRWGWRKRGQRVEIVGNFAEQTVELVFAPWSLFTYKAATAPLEW